jgi:hypothetical protein
MHSYDQYFWIDSVERLKGILLEQQLPFILFKAASQRCYGYDEEYLYTDARFPRHYNEWAIEQTERYPKGKLLWRVEFIIGVNG